MKPIDFPQVNRVLAKDQPQYQPLPICYCDDGSAISCWKLSIWERLRLLLTGKLWLIQLTFHQPLQPQLPLIKEPGWVKNG
jgi:hypothetical protein